MDNEMDKLDVKEFQQTLKELIGHVETLSNEEEYQGELDEVAESAKRLVTEFDAIETDQMSVSQHPKLIPDMAVIFGFLAELSELDDEESGEFDYDDEITHDDETIS